jgi:hypothetical protein
MPTQNDWPPLSKLPLERYGADAIVAAQEIVGRGQIPVHAVRGDIPGSTTAEPVDTLLKKATRADVWLPRDEITMHFEGSAQDVRAILGPRSDFDGVRSATRLAWSYSDSGPREWTIKLRNARAHQPSLAQALEVSGIQAAATNTVERLAEWIFSLRFEERTCDKLYEKALLDRPLSSFKKADILDAYGSVYETERHHPPAAGWPLREPYKSRAEEEAKSFG